MADKLITERVGKNGNVSYLVRIREAGVKANKTFKTIKEAEKFIREVKTKIDKGESVDIAKIKKLTLTAIFDEYLKHNVVARGKKYTVEKLKLELGVVPLSTFKAGNFALYLNAKRQQEIPDQKKKKKAHPSLKGTWSRMRKLARWSRRSMLRDHSQNLLCNQECS